MSEAPKVLADRQFIETCLQLNLLDDTEADSLRAALCDDNVFAVQAALQRGLLTPTDVDIVQSLQHPVDIVPGYKILEMIGRGGMGVVYRAEQLDLEKIIALKTILISNVHDPTVAARFEREAKSLARLQHPNIVQALNFGKHEGRYYFAMEYVDGRTCEQTVNESGFMPEREVWSVVRQIASGLMHALGHNLIHRDIKPANIILLPPPEGAVDATELVKIADFGLAMFADQSVEQLKLTTGDKIMGSPAYMSLEQFGGRKVDFRSDMYSLGATAWHLLFGKPPFQGRSVAALFQQKSNPLVIDPAALPVKIPNDQMRLLIGLLDPDPTRRPPSYEQFIDAIDALEIWDQAEASNEQYVTRPQRSPGDLGSDEPTQEMPVASDERVSPAVTQAVIQADAPSVTQASNVASSDSMSATILLPQSSPQLWQRRSTWLVGIALLTISALVFGAVVSRSPARGERVYKQVVGNTPLFDGVTLSGWDVGGSMVGAWNTVEAPDSSTAIACTTGRGALTRRIPVLPNPRISLFVWLQKGCGPVDIDFALDPLSKSDTRGCLRLSELATQLGEKTTDFGELKTTARKDAPPTIRQRYNVVHIERQPTDWYVFLEEQLVGTLPIEEVGDGTAIRLIVHGQKNVDTEQSQAFFADVQLYEMRE